MLLYMKVMIDFGFLFYFIILVQRKRGRFLLFLCRGIQCGMWGWC